ncbi:hypothetical protein, partial [Nocardia sp. NPDC058497]|uniref:hypothetical protein n=1 Tax=Nocardia sp. NPDC058497 TaxID=3346529 RepID=UPI00365DCF77
PSPPPARLRAAPPPPPRPGHPRYESYGLPKTLAADLADQRVTARERLLGESEIDRMDLAREHASLRQRHGLSIEHNADLTEQNAELTRRLTAMTAERDQAVTERRDSDMKRVQALAEQGRLRVERDEAVAKLVETTRPGDRFGSAERQATEARAAATATSTKSATATATASTGSESAQSPSTESVPWETESGVSEQPSARTAYSGNALADAMNRRAERGGMER